MVASSRASISAPAWRSKAGNGRRHDVLPCDGLITLFDDRIWSWSTVPGRSGTAMSLGRTGRAGLRVSPPTWSPGPASRRPPGTGCSALPGQAPAAGHGRRTQLGRPACNCRNDGIKRPKWPTPWTLPSMHGGFVTRLERRCCKPALWPWDGLAGAVGSVWPASSLPAAGPLPQGDRGRAGGRGDAWRMLRRRTVSHSRACWWRVLIGWRTGAFEMKQQPPRPGTTHGLRSTSARWGAWRAG